MMYTISPASAGAKTEMTLGRIRKALYFDGEKLGSVPNVSLFPT